MKSGLATRDGDVDEVALGQGEVDFLLDLDQRFFLRVFILVAGIAAYVAVLIDVDDDVGNFAPRLGQSRWIAAFLLQLSE